MILSPGSRLSPALVIVCLRFPLIMTEQRETFTFKLTRLESRMLLFLCLYGFFPPVTNLQFCLHKAKHLGDEWETQSATSPLCLHCEYQQASGPSAETCPSPSSAGCYAGTAPACFETKLMSFISLVSL